MYLWWWKTFVQLQGFTMYLYAWNLQFCDRSQRIVLKHHIVLLKMHVPLTIFSQKCASFKQFCRFFFPYREQRSALILHMFPLRFFTQVLFWYQFKCMCFTFGRRLSKSLYISSAKGFYATSTWYWWSYILQLPYKS